MRYLLVALLLCLPVKVSGETNLSFKVPTLPIAENVVRKDNGIFILSELRYSTKINHPQEVLDFYNEFFTNNGWYSPANRFENTGTKPQWYGKQHSVTKDNKPEISYLYSWESEENDNSLKLNLILTNWSNNVFLADIEIALVRNTNPKNQRRLIKLINKHPENFFILFDIIGSNPIEIDKVVLPPSVELKDNKLFQQYKTIIEAFIIDSHSKD
ncbi:hypothetical protein [Desulfofustis glycolicus]|uniref:Uncharacterized protein n=1 Tax=Desulfofustis glycolicus DSM 9705 TaxID=1121409 RepID=A0A1M5YWU3_9BACT|nr:hypothetical protein [Desulfofustis glycolicus]MCB2217677.1 hypothetical protein [Desulfobulbaceae bacterium]SHI16023.1 hypothetical protein SAMN02745124_04494 [Desulfofustis glycolicus DSM 9705]